MALLESITAKAIASPLGDVVSSVEVIVGGIFGLYLLMFLLNIYRIAATRRMMGKMREDMKTLDHKLNSITEHMGIYMKDEAEERKMIKRITEDLKKIKERVGKEYKKRKKNFQAKRKKK